MSPWQEHNLAEITRRLSPLCRARQGVLFDQHSSYNHIVVRKGRNQLLLCYRHRQSRIEEVQSRLVPSRPFDLPSPYTQAMLLALMWCPKPRRMLFVGLGGGRLQMVLHHIFEDAQLDTVEIDPLVVDVATRFFGFLPDERQRIFLADGRAHVREATACPAYDLIFLDAYQAEGVPAHLLTYDFYAACRACLDQYGLVISNLHSSTPVYDAARKTFAASFIHTTACSVQSGNVIVLGSEAVTLNPQTIWEHARVTQDAYAGVLPFSKWVKNISLRVPYQSSARILRDSGLSVSI